MKIIVDAFGGDNAPLEIIKGCVDAVNEFDDLSIILTGDEAIIKRVMSENNLSDNRIEIYHCTEVITMEDPADAVLKTKKDSSMAVGFKLLNEEAGDAFVSAGNSGALCVGATLAVKRIKGIKRPAFSPVLPSDNGCFIVMDAGANVDCRPEMLYQFAVMGSIYMNKVMKVENPRIGLLNVGSEEGKGTELYKTTYNMLKESNLNFIGNIEGRDVPEGKCDVVVCDGFAGNVFIKTYEGVALLIMDKIKSIFTSSLKNKLAAGLVLSDINKLKKELDYNEYGGAAIIGASRPVFKAHGSSKARTIKSAIRICRDYVSADAISEISKAIQEKSV
ncbi:MAG: phosphate acyltransferase PlsX [Ruminococcus sp.]|nr:phosphate acyltransferase PlsX [Ruminococcus sp.]